VIQLVLLLVLLPSARLHAQIVIHSLTTNAHQLLNQHHTLDWESVIQQPWPHSLSTMLMITECLQKLQTTPTSVVWRLHPSNGSQMVSPSCGWDTATSTTGTLRLINLSLRTKLQRKLDHSEEKAARIRAVLGVMVQTHAKLILIPLQALLATNWKVERATALTHQPKQLTLSIAQLVNTLMDGTQSTTTTKDWRDSTSAALTHWRRPLEQKQN